MLDVLTLLLNCLNGAFDNVGMFSVMLIQCQYTFDFNHIMY